MSDIQVFFPSSADETNVIDFSLTGLTEAISHLDTTRLSHGLLGGEFGYGAHFENRVFLMHPFCWCSADECPWCGGCNCEDQSCAWCRGETRWADKGALPPSMPPYQGAPNFWHKPSGLRVWWYKYIGRSMEIHNPSGADFASVIRECIESLPKGATP